MNNSEVVKGVQINLHSFNCLSLNNLHKKRRNTEDEVSAC